jgi:hypothetical protein
MNIQIQYVYLLQTREYLNSGESIYKVGKTKELNYTRFKQYPSGSVLLFQSVCNNCDIIEQKIIKLFKTKYVNHKIAGREFFKGDLRLMISDLCHLIDNEKTNTPTNTAANTSFIKDIVDDVVNEIIDGIVVQEPDSKEIKTPCFDDCDSSGKYSCKVCKFYTDLNGNLKQHCKTNKVKR